MDREQLLALFGLPKDASDEDIRACAGKLTSQPGTSEMVPRADYDLLKSKHDTMLAAVEEENRKRFEQQCEAAVDAAVVAGKIAPASKAYHLKSCKRGADALAEFEDFVKEQPAMVSNEQTKNIKDNETNGTLTKEEREVCKMLNLTEEQYRASQKHIEENPEVYPPTVYRA